MLVLSRPSNKGAQQAGDVRGGKFPCLLLAACGEPRAPRSGLETIFLTRKALSEIDLLRTAMTPA